MTQVNYRGERTPCADRVTRNGVPLNPRLDLFNHSPDGFSWGYGGSGPAQLALALLADATGDDDLAVEAHQEFKEERIAPLALKEWWMTAAEIREWARQWRIDNP